MQFRCSVKFGAIHKNQIQPGMALITSKEYEDLLNTQYPMGSPVTRDDRLEHVFVTKGTVQTDTAPDGHPFDHVLVDAYERQMDGSYTKTDPDLSLDLFYDASRNTSGSPSDGKYPWLEELSNFFSGVFKISP